MIKVKDLLEQDVDIDVYDDVCDDLAIAFCGPMELTDEGKERFKTALELPIHLCTDYVLVEVDDEDENVMWDRLNNAKELFEGMAGFCSEENWNKWFKH